MSQKQKEHSRLFQLHKTGRKLRDLTRQGEGEIQVISQTPKPFITGNPHCPSYPRPYYRNISREADAIVVGTVRERLYSQLTDDGEFIFSDYVLTVDEVIKSSAGGRVKAGTDITVTRPGGLVQLNGRVIRGLAGNFSQFQTGERYLLFLKYVPSTSSYVAFGNGSYHLRGERARSLYISAGGAQEQDASELVRQVRDAYSAGPCGNSPRLY